MSYLADFENELPSIQPLWNVWYVDEKIGGGNQSIVYRLKRVEIDGSIYYSALKIISLPSDESEFQHIFSMKRDPHEAKVIVRDMVQELTKEIAIMYELKGLTNIVGYEDHLIIPAEEGRRYYALIRMELLKNFVTILRERELSPLSENDVIRLGIDICSALEICQKHSIVHRDIKPDNLFMSSEGYYKLGDFGVSRKLEQTMMVSTKGTISYMSPELFHKKSCNIKSDIYSLGIVMYQLLNENRFPLLRSDYRYGDIEKAVIARLAGSDLPLPECARNDLGRVVLRACAYAMEDRFNDPSEMKHALEALIVDRKWQNTELSIEPAKGKTKESDSRQRVVMFFLPAALCLIIIAIIPVLFFQLFDNNTRLHSPSAPDNEQVLYPNSSDPLDNEDAGPDNEPVSLPVNSNKVISEDRGSGNSEQSPASVPPSSPTGLKAVQSGKDSALISWDSVPGATSYEAEYYNRELSSWESDPDFVSTTDTSYTSMRSGSYDTYSYRIRAVNSAVSSVWSQECTYQHMSELKGLKIQQSGIQSAFISWTPVTGATFYEVEYYNRESQSWISDPDYELKTHTSYVSNGLSDYDSYQYRVRAVNSTYASEWSEAKLYKINEEIFE